MKLAILLTTYNSEKYLESQINSLYNQTFLDWDLYISDDGSQDNTLNIIAIFKNLHSNIYLITSPMKKIGPKLNFLNLLSIVSADYYMFCDHDDVWLSHKISVSLEAIRSMEQKYGNIPILIHTDLQVVDFNLNIISPSFWSYSHIPVNLVSSFEYLSVSNSVTGCTMLINKNAKNVSFPVSSYSTMHDHWIALCVSSNGGIVFPIHEATILYRQHGDNSIGARRVDLDYLIGKIYAILSVIRNNYILYKMANACRSTSLWCFLRYKILFFINRIKS